MEEGDGKKEDPEDYFFKINLVKGRRWIEIIESRLWVRRRRSLFCFLKPLTKK